MRADAVPILLRQAVVDKIAELQRQELDFAWEVTHPFEEYLLDWRTRIERFFLDTFVISLRPDHVQHWDYISAQQAGFTEDVLDPMVEGLDALAEDAAAVAEQRERDAFWLGSLFGRWQLALGGIEDPNTPWPTYAALAIGGLGFAERAAGWSDVYGTKLRSLFGGLVASQATLPDTLGMLDPLITSFTNRIGQLARNEWYHAAVEGEHAAVKPFQAAIGELWLIKDESACPICKALNLTITAKIPIKDSHPSCRCIKVPVAKQFTPTPISLTTFADRHAQRPS
jgi:hypothetical protein